MVMGTGTMQPATRDQHRAERASDARAMTSELYETLGVLVVPALLFSALSLFFG